MCHCLLCETVVCGFDLFREVVLLYTRNTNDSMGARVLAPMAALVLSLVGPASAQGGGMAICANVPEQCVAGITGQLGNIEDCGSMGPMKYECCSWMGLCQQGFGPTGSVCATSMDCTMGSWCDCGTTDCSSPVAHTCKEAGCYENTMALGECARDPTSSACTQYALSPACTANPCIDFLHCYRCMGGPAVPPTPYGACPTGDAAGRRRKLQPLLAAKPKGRGLLFGLAADDDEAPTGLCVATDIARRPQNCGVAA